MRLAFSVLLSQVQVTTVIVSWLMLHCSSTAAAAEIKDEHWYVADQPKAPGTLHLTLPCIVECDMAFTYVGFCLLVCFTCMHRCFSACIACFCRTVLLVNAQLRRVAKLSNTITMTCIICIIRCQV